MVRSIWELWTPVHEKIGQLSNGRILHMPDAFGGFLLYDVSGKRTLSMSARWGQGCCRRVRRAMPLLPSSCRQGQSQLAAPAEFYPLDDIN
jgi:hypothetical protein